MAVLAEGYLGEGGSEVRLLLFQLADASPVPPAPPQTDFRHSTGAHINHASLPEMHTTRKQLDDDCP